MKSEREQSKRMAQHSSRLAQVTTCLFVLNLLSTTLAGGNSLSDVLENSNKGDGIKVSETNIVHSSSVVKPDEFKHELDYTRGDDEVKLSRFVRSELSNYDDEKNVDNKEEAEKPHENPVLRRILSATQRAIAPAKQYYNLIQRYKSWFERYNTLRKASTSQDGRARMRSALDLISYEYSKVDKSLVDNSSCLSERAIRDELEKVDFVLEALKSLIEKLEQKMNDIESKGLDSADNQDVLADGEFESADDKLERDEQVKQAVDRIKRILFKGAKNLAQQEMRRVVQLILFNLLMNQIQAGDLTGIGPVDNGLDLLKPLLLLMSRRTETSLLVGYLRDIQSRVTFGFVKSSVETLIDCGHVANDSLGQPNFADKMEAVEMKNVGDLPTGKDESPQSLSPTVRGWKKIRPVVNWLL